MKGSSMSEGGGAQAHGAIGSPFLYPQTAPLAVCLAWLPLAKRQEPAAPAPVAAAAFAAALG